MKSFLALTLAALALTACAPEPPDPHLSSINAPSVIVLTDGRRIECPRVKEAGRGWECWGDIDSKEYGPRAWYPPSAVVAVERSPADAVKP